MRKKGNGFSNFIDRNLMRLIGAFVALWQVACMALMYCVLVTDEGDLSEVIAHWYSFAWMTFLAVIALVAGELLARWERKVMHD